MSYLPIPTRTSLNANSASDINQLQENISIVKADVDAMDVSALDWYSSQAMLAGDQGTGINLDLSTYSYYSIEIHQAPTITLSANPPFPAHAQIKLINKTDLATTITWGTTIKWAGGEAFSAISETQDKIDFINLFYDGANYYGTFSMEF